MCMECWESYGKPKVWNHHTKFLWFLIDSIYVPSEHTHNVVEDWNLEDQFLEPKEEGNHIDNFVLGAMRACTLEERASVMAVIDGLWKPDEEAS